MKVRFSKWLVGVAVLICASSAFAAPADPGTSYDSAPVIPAWRYGGGCDQATIADALAKCTAGGVVKIPAGTCTLTSNITLPGLSGCTIEGAGPTATILDCSTIVGDCLTSGTVANTYTLKNLTIKGALTGGATPNAVKVRKTDRNVSIENVDFDLTTGNGVYCNGCTGLRIAGSNFFSDGDFATTTEKPRAVYFDQGASEVVVDSSRLDYLYDGLYVVGTATEPIRNISLTESTIDGGAWSSKTRHTNSGATVSFTSTTIVDSSAPFTANSIAATTLVRIMTTLQSGTVTSTTGGRLHDTAANFPSGTLRGDIVRTATAFALVEQRVSSTVLSLTEWRSLTTYRPVAAPIDGTAYTLYGVALGEAANATNTTSTITVHRWFDATGVTVTPASQSRYEVLWHRGGYGVKTTTGVEGVVIANNRFLRGPSAFVELSGKGGSFIGNACKDGMDGCIGIQGGGRATIVGNQSDHTGFFAALYGGTAPDGDGSVVTGNTVRDARWTYKGAPPTYGMMPIVIRSSDNNVVSGNTIEKGSLVTGVVPYGIYIDDDPVSSAGNDSTGNIVADNQISGFDTADVRLEDVDAASTEITGLRISISDGGGAGTTVNGIPLLSAPPATAAAAVTGRRYWDTELNEECVCNGTPAWVQQDGGGACS